LFRTERAYGLLYCPWTATKDWDFDGQIEGLMLPWSPDRLDLIKNSKADLTDEEIAQWRQAKCRQLASGSDWAVPAWVVPLRLEGEIAAWSLFVCEGDEEMPPALVGVYDSAEDAETELGMKGAIAAG
jgi:hypothetical protein